MAHIFKLNGDYDCTVTDIAGLEGLCEEIVIEELEDKIKETLNREAEVKVSWVYDGYRVFVKDKLTETEVQDVVYSLDPLKQIDTCNMFWDVKDNKNYTGILLAYDYKHYLRVLTDSHSFIILANKGLDEFMRRLALKYAFIDPKLELKYEKDRSYEKKVLGEKLKGVEFKAEVKVEKERITGRMHVRDKTNPRGNFDDYWRKKNGVPK